MLDASTDPFPATAGPLVLWASGFTWDLTRRAGFPRQEHDTDSPDPPRGDPRRQTAGFSLLELTIVLVISAITMTLAMVAFTGYFERSSAKSAAQVFVRDLALARSTAVRIQQPVSVRFYESSLWYSVQAVETGTEIVRRRFGLNADIDLSGIDLQFRGDSVVFNPRGIADLGRTGPPKTALGVAVFSFGAISYEVSFNSMGASRVEEN
jgi:prepilin-type N-terminal cleavage/methylation domain-containing protein